MKSRALFIAKVDHRVGPAEALRSGAVSWTKDDGSTTIPKTWP